MNLKRIDLYDKELEIAAQRVLLGWKAAGQPLNVESLDQEVYYYSQERTVNVAMTFNSEQKILVPEKSFDNLLSLAHSILQ